MNFFEHQKQARKESKFLWVLFIFAVIAIVIAVNLAVWAGVNVYLAHTSDSYSTSSYPFDDPSGDDPSRSGPSSADLQVLLFVCTTLITLMVIFLGSAFKTSALRLGGGDYVARSIGARRIEADTTDPLEKRLVNVVEEMAIASGANVPSIWLMENETGINAFAAGYAPSEAAIAVSKGCLTELTRDELQGVVAHEFSHVFNGDMRANIRMLGMLHGILVIGLTGYWAVRILGQSRPRTRSSSSDKKDNTGAILLAILVVGALLIAIGYIGVLFGRLIKASLSRTREYLADASAVQFTRNPAGIAGALAKIHRGTGSRIQSGNAEQFSHFYFADGIGFLLPVLATHPPLTERLNRILPNWEKEVREEKSKPADQLPTLRELSEKKTKLADSIGTSGVQQIAFAAQLLESLPNIIHKLCSVPQGAKLIFIALLNAEHDSIPVAIDGMSSEIPSEVLRDAHRRLRDLGESKWLAVANLCVPSLQKLNAEDRKTFIATCNEIVSMDLVTTTFEASLLSVLERSLAPLSEKRRVKNTRLEQIRTPLISLAAILAKDGHEDESARYVAFRKGLEHANLLGQLPESLPEVSVETMPKLLASIAQASPELKEIAMELLCEISNADGVSTPREKEILRTVAAALECPLPPFV